MTVRLLIGDMRERLCELEPDSIDSCCTDPPYHLTSGNPSFDWGAIGPNGPKRPNVGPTNKSGRGHKTGFMGQKWDGGDVAFQRATWEAVFRVLKPGGHLIAFSGTRTYHRMVCAIEDAGFEIRDQLAWIYGSGFPKSHDVAKAVEATLKSGSSSTVAMRRAAMGEEYEQYAGAGHFRDGTTRAKNAPNPKGAALTATTAEAEQWQGWGTALKPSQEPLCLARKPWTNEQEWITIRSLIEGLWSALWWMLPASDAVKDSALNPRACGVGLRASVQWSAERLSNTRADLSAQMDMSQFELALISSLNTVSSWNATLAAACRAENTSTTETASSPTIDLRTLKSCLSKITPESIILAHRPGAWSSADACNAGRYLNATLATFAATLELSALERAGDLAAISSPDAVEISPNWEPICLARKPLVGTVAANVLKHGTGALNIDGCRVEAGGDDLNGGAYRGDGSSRDDGWGMQRLGGAGEYQQPNGRWPANIIHDGSEEVLAGFPESDARDGVNKGTKNRGELWASGWAEDGQSAGRNDTGSAARFFYCAKATSAERNAGCDPAEGGGKAVESAHSVVCAKCNRQRVNVSGQCECAEPEWIRKPQRPQGNNHPTVKPVDLMRWLVRLVTPKGGTVLDPFAGSGSTLIAADAEQFHAIGCELSPEYAAIAEQRIRTSAGMFTDLEAA